LPKNGRGKPSPNDAKNIDTMNKYNPKIHHRRSIRLKGYDYSQAGLYFITICCQDRMYRFGTVQDGEMILNDFGMIAHEEWIKLAERFPNFELDVFQIMPNHMHGIIMLNNVGAGFTPAHNILDAQNDAVIIGAGFTPAQNILDTQNDAVIIGAGASPAENETPKNHAANKNDGNVWAGFTPTHHDETSQNHSVADIGAGASPAPTVSDIVGAYKSLVSNGCLSIYKSKNETMGKLWQRNYWEHIIRNEHSYQTISQYIINNPAKWQDDKFYIS
jgi:REP element-mobilizing transposase RayT